MRFLTESLAKGIASECVVYYYYRKLPVACLQNTYDLAEMLDYSSTNMTAWSLANQIWSDMSGRCYTLRYLHKVQALDLGKSLLGLLVLIITFMQ